MDDFTSLVAKGVPVRTANLKEQRLHTGISVFATAQQARNRANDTPWLGEFIARLDLPDDAPVRIERTLRSRGHHTVWGPSDFLLLCVVSVEAVGSGESG